MWNLYEKIIFADLTMDKLFGKAPTVKGAFSHRLETEILHMMFFGSTYN